MVRPRIIGNPLLLVQPARSWIFVEFNMAVLSALGAEVFSVCPSKENELSDLGHYITTHDTRMVQYAYDDILKADLMKHTVGLLNLPSGFLPGV
jgi:hypothetical protein